VGTHGVLGGDQAGRTKRHGPLSAQDNTNPCAHRGYTKRSRSIVEMSQQTMMNPAAPQIPMTRTQSIGSGGTAALSPGLGCCVGSCPAGDVRIGAALELGITDP
jgi:hypothetical protein